MHLALGALAMPVSSSVAEAVESSVAADQKGASLGDLSEYIGIAKDTQTIVKSGDFQAAKKRIRDLEKTWDANEDKHRPLNPAAWTKADDLMDRAIDKLRAQHPDPAVVNSALDDLINNLQSQNKPAK
jgi:hypothetical protein